MPLSELYRMAKGKLDSTHDKNNANAVDLSSPENDVFELVWENGQILLQGQSSGTRKNSNFSTLQPQCLPSHTPRPRDGDIGHLNNAKVGKFGAIDSVVRDVIALAPSPEVELTHDDDTVPWLNYPLDGNLQHEYSSDFLPELSGVTVNDVPSYNNVASSIDKGTGGNQVTRDADLISLHASNLEVGNISKLCSLDGIETARPRSSTNQLYSSASQQCQASFPHLRTKNTSGTGNTTSKAPHDALSGNSPQVPSIAGSSSSTTRQNLDPTPPTNSSNILNFSHFLRPVALLKSNDQNQGVTGTVGLSSTRSLGSMDKDCSATGGHPPKSSLIGMRGSMRKESNSCCKNAIVPSMDDSNPSEAKSPEQTQAAKQPEVACLENSSKKDGHPRQCLDIGSTRGLPDGGNAAEPVIAASVCSRNSVEGASHDPIHNVKRKCHDIEDSECPSDDIEEESIDVKRATPVRGTGSKRSRAAEVHNLSERRRRDRINEKMRALQELIPNCNKVDKASMLDEAIEYLKTLQLQVQIMSMGAGLFMPPMMFPGGMQPLSAPHMAHYSPMGLGMGMGFGIGMPDMNGGSHGYPVVQVPHMHGTHFPGQCIPGQTVMHGMPGSNFQVLGLGGQGLQMPMPRAPIAPFSGGPFMTNSCMAVAPVENVSSAAASSSKDASQNINTPMAPNSGIDILITPAPRQANEPVSCANGRAANSTRKDVFIPN